MRYRLSVLLATAVLAAAIAPGCGREPESDLFAEAERLCLEQQWEEAVPVLKQCLLEEPENAGAHFYLGRCYLNGEPFLPHIAEGEILTALHLFERAGRHSPIERFDDDYFEFICYIESAKVALNTIRLLTNQGVPLANLRGLITTMKEYGDKAEAVLPDAEDLAQMRSIISGLEANMNRQPPGRFPTTDPVIDI